MKTMTTNAHNEHKDNSVELFENNDYKENKSKQEKTKRKQMITEFSNEKSVNRFLTQKLQPKKERSRI